jgi:hypothetical protein
MSTDHLCILNNAIHFIEDCDEIFKIGMKYQILKRQ